MIKVAATLIYRIGGTDVHYSLLTDVAPALTLDQFQRLTPQAAEARARQLEDGIPVCRRYSRVNAPTKESAPLEITLFEGDLFLVKYTIKVNGVAAAQVGTPAPMYATLPIFLGDVVEITANDTQFIHRVESVGLEVLGDDRDFKFKVAGLNPAMQIFNLGAGV